MENYTGTSILDILTNNFIPNGEHSFTNVNSVNLGSVEVLNFYGNHTPTNADMNSTYFSDVTTDQDNIMCIRIFHGNLTINSGVTFKPPFRTKGLFVLVKNNLTNNGTMSMSGLGSTAPAPSGAVVLWSGASIPKDGGVGGLVRTVSGSTSNGVGGAGNAPLSGAPTRGTGGGGSGAAARLGQTTASSGTSGAGAQGTAWSGGAGGGAVVSWNRSDSADAGVRSTGGNGSIEVSTGSWTANAFMDVGGGAGNPQGQGVRVSATGSSINTSGSTLTASNDSDGGLGAGGLLMIAVLNKYLHGGSFSVAGSKGGNGNTNIVSFNALFTANGTPSGGGSGGGSLNLIAKQIRNNNDSAEVSSSLVESEVTINGGTGGDAQFTSGSTTTNVNIFVGGSGSSGTAKAELSSTTYRRHLFYSGGNNYYYNPTTSQWVQATGTGTEPFEQFGMLDGELYTITRSLIAGIDGVNLNSVTIRSYVPN